MSAPNDKRTMPWGGSFAIQDSEVIAVIKGTDYSECLWQDTVTKNFCNIYRDWISTTELNTVTGLDLFPHAVYSNGTSQAFELFYIKNKNKRFRCYKGEYIYHQLAWRNNWPNWKFIEDDVLRTGDAVVISLPFSDTGNMHERMEWLLETCTILDIPVLVDCAYFGTCRDIDFDLTMSCITDVVFSLSKAFPVAHARIGIRFSKVDDDDLMFVYDKINYNNRMGAHLGITLLESFGPDFINIKYKNKQELCCRLLGVEPSNTVTFGIDTHQRFNEYNRGSSTNRLGFYKYYTMTEKEIQEFIHASSNT